MEPSDTLGQKNNAGDNTMLCSVSTSYKAFKFILKKIKSNYQEKCVQSIMSHLILNHKLAEWK